MGNFNLIYNTLEKNNRPMTFDELLAANNLNLSPTEKSFLYRQMCMDGKLFYIKKTGKWHIKNMLPKMLWYQGIDKYYEDDFEEDVDQEERAMLNEEYGIEEPSEEDED